MELSEIVDDLDAEWAALDVVVDDLRDGDWARPTPSPGWTVADQIAHLTHFDGTATLAISDPEAFAAHRDEFAARRHDGPVALDDWVLRPYRTMSPAALVTGWRSGRAALGLAARGLGGDERIEWYGPSMGARSFVTARLMETWAHGQDICDAVGAMRPATDRLAHIARLGTITRRWSYTVRGLEPPDEPVAVRLIAPGGEIWDLGEPEATASVTGPAEDFCLVVTRRRHVDDTSLVISGDAAADWMSIAQAFAGRAAEAPPRRGR